MFPRIITFIQIAAIIACPMGCASGLCEEECCDSIRLEMNSSDSQCDRQKCCETEIVEAEIVEAEIVEAVESTETCCGGSFPKADPTDRCDLPAKFSSCSTCPDQSFPDQSCPIDSGPSKCLQCICSGAVFERPIEIDQVFASDLDSLACSMVNVAPLLREAKCFDNSRGRHAPHCNVGRYLCILQHSFLI
jgi:hypothetical protein